MTVGLTLSPFEIARCEEDGKRKYEERRGWKGHYRKSPLETVVMGEFGEYAGKRLLERVLGAHGRVEHVRKDTRHHPDLRYAGVGIEVKASEKWVWDRRLVPSVPDTQIGDMIARARIAMFLERDAEHMLWHHWTELEHLRGLEPEDVDGIYKIRVPKALLRDPQTIRAYFDGLLRGATPGG